MASSDMGSQSQESGGQRSSTMDQAKNEAGRLTQVARSRTVSPGDVGAGGLVS